MAQSVLDVVTGELVAWLEARARPLRAGREPSAVVVALTGAQGAGKTTLLTGLEAELGARGYRLAVLSLDDFYLTHAERMRLARDVHPLFKTRGVPGTHDIPLLERTLDALRKGRGASVPVFDKAADDRATRDQWRTVPRGPFDLVVVEGWCLALPPESPEALVAPVNALEQNEDPDGIWRRAVNAALETSYRELFETFDRVIALMAPNFDTVFRWRRQQESELEQKLRSEDPRRRGLLSTDEELRRFLAHFERLTLHGSSCLSKCSDIQIFLDERRQLSRVGTGPATA